MKLKVGLVVGLKGEGTEYKVAEIRKNHILLQSQVNEALFIYVTDWSLIVKVKIL